MESVVAILCKSGLMISWVFAWNALLATDYTRAVEGDQILLGDNLELLTRFGDGEFQLIYIDPPFNTGRSQVRSTIATTADEAGDRVGFGGRRYRSELLERSS